MSKIPQALKDVMGIEVADLLEEIRDFLAPNDYKDTIRIDLSVAHTELRYDMPTQIKINSMTVMPVPSAMSLKINDTADEAVELEVTEGFTFTKHEIERFYVSNEAGEGIARLYIFGRVEG